MYPNRQYNEFPYTDDKLSKEDFQRTTNKCEFIDSGRRNMLFRMGRDANQDTAISCIDIKSEGDKVKKIRETFEKKQAQNTQRFGEIFVEHATVNPQKYILQTI